MLEALAPAAIASHLFAYTARTLDVSSTPGASVVVANARGIVACRGFGLDGNRGPMNCDTRVVLASLTKAFTALAVLQLERHGELNLDAPVQRYVPWFSVENARWSSEITVRELLNQRSGFSESSGRSWLASTQGDDGALARRVRALQSVDLAAAPGARFEYSNANYDVLGVVISAVARMPYKAYVRTHVLQPLGLMHARFSCLTDDPHGYVRIFSRPVAAGRQPQFCADSAAGGLVMTASEYGRFLAANVDAGRSWSQALLDRSGWELLHRSPGGAPYAMGWYASAYSDGLRELRHVGEAPGFRSFAVVLPDRDIAAALLTDVDEVPDAGRSDLMARDFSRTLEGRATQPLDAVPPDIYLRLGVLAAVVFQAAMLLRRRTPGRRNPVTPLINLAVVVAIFWFVLPLWGGSPFVGFLFSPDLTILVLTLVGLLLLNVVRWAAEPT